MSVNMFEYKVAKLSDDECFELATKSGRIMERGRMTPEEKYNAHIIFTECAKRTTLEEHRIMFLTCLRVLRYF